MRWLTLMAMLTFVPAVGAGEVKSGLQPGEEVAAWNPIHIAGPDRGTTKCPICTYLGRPMVVIFAKDGANAAALAGRLEKLVEQQARHELKGFTLVIDGNADALATMAKDQKIVRSALCLLDPSSAAKDLRELYKVHPDAQNTIIVYRDYRVMANFVNLDARDFGRVEAAMRQLLR